MEKDTEVQETSEAAIATMANNVLNIGDDKSEINDGSRLPTPGKHYESNFDEEFKERLIKLMLPGTSPLPKINDTDLLEQFSGRRIERNRRVFYQFDCKDFGGGTQSRTRHEPGMTIISGPAVNAKHVLQLVRERLKDFNWISDNVVECRTKDEKEYWYMQGVVTDCLNEEENKLYNYILCLQQQYRNDN